MTLPTWDTLPDYRHSPGCQWSHVQKCCPSGCNGEPVDYPMTIEHAEFLARWSK